MKKGNFSDFYLPAIELSRETTVLGLAREEPGHHLLPEKLAIPDDEGAAVGKPANGIRVSLVCENGHQTLREDELAVIIAFFASVLVLFVDNILLGLGFCLDFFFGTHVVLLIDSC
jgi:hypothetical protein